MKKQKLPKSKHFCIYNHNSEFVAFLGRVAQKFCPGSMEKQKIQDSHPHFCFLGRNLKKMDSIFEKQTNLKVLIKFVKNTKSKVFDLAWNPKGPRKPRRTRDFREETARSIRPLMQLQGLQGKARIREKRPHEGVHRRRTSSLAFLSPSLVSFPLSGLPPGPVGLHQTPLRTN